MVGKYLNISLIFPVFVPDETKSGGGIMFSRGTLDFRNNIRSTILGHSSRRFVPLQTQ